MKNNADYKACADLHCRLKIFNVGDYVMVRLRSEQFSLSTVKKLHARSARPFQILKRINSNIYMVDLSPDFDISCTFNVEDLIPYRGIFDTLSDPLMDERTHDLLSESPTISTSSKIIPCNRKYRFYFE